MQSLEEIHDFVLAKYETQHMERFTHTLGVVKMAAYLAKKYGVDESKAKIAAYMHDYCKYDSQEELVKKVRKEDLAECLKYPVLFHSYVSAEVYINEVGKDLDVYNAIRNHVFGRLDMSKLEEIILISDYTEENRKYQNCILVREMLLKGMFYKAIYESTKFTINYVEKQGFKPHPLQLEVLKFYEGLCEE